jgi:hypothetical protein
MQSSKGSGADLQLEQALTHQYRANLGQYLVWSHMVW